MSSKILIIDDSRDWQRMLELALREEGHYVRTVSTREAALEILQTETFDFAFVDMVLSGDTDSRDGWALAQSFNIQMPEMVVIIFTGSQIDREERERAQQYLGVTNIIEKSLDWTERVIQSIRRTAPKTIRPQTHLTIVLEPGQPIYVRARGTISTSRITRKNLLLDLERYVRLMATAKKDASDFHFRAQDLGRGLWRELFGEYPEVERTFRDANANRPLLYLHFEGTRELLRLPLELIHQDDPEEFLAKEHPIGRFVRDARRHRNPISPNWFVEAEKLRVLIIASNTDPPISGVDDETAALYKYFQEQQHIQVEATWIKSEQATYDRIEQELRENVYDIIHYAGHAVYEPDSPDDSALYLRPGLSGKHKLTANTLQYWLKESQVCLFYLSCCDGAETAKRKRLLDDDFLGIADAITQAGVPSVLGYRWPVSDGGAIILALEFYKSLLKQGSPEVALWEARGEVASKNNNDPTWLSPILIYQE